MRRLKVPEDWRPRGTMLIWIYAGSFLTCMGVSFIGQFFGLAGEGITVYPPVNWLSWVLLVFSYIAVAVFLSLVAGISMNKEYPSPQAHPFITLEFWVSALGFIILAFVASAILNTIGGQVGAESEASQTGAVVGIILSVVGITVGYVNAIRRYAAAGLSFGAGAFFLICLSSLLL